MPRFAANLSLLYNEYTFFERFTAAAQDGFEAVEFLFPYAFEAKLLRQHLDDNGLSQVLFNAPPGDWDAGERGLACLPGRESEFQSGFLKALSYADALNCSRIHVMAGLKPSGADEALLEKTYLQNIAWAAAQAHESNCDVLIEPINTRDMPRFFLNYQSQAHQLVEQIGASNVKVQMDLYHCQIMEGDVATKIRHFIPTGQVGHIQIAGVPMRHEPDLGELNYRYLCEVLDEVSVACKWDGWVGCEYRPSRGAIAHGTRDGLGWLSTTSAPKT
jgi:hydroxypyruvate isomerase